MSAIRSFCAASVGSAGQRSKCRVDAMLCTCTPKDHRGGRFDTCAGPAGKEGMRWGDPCAGPAGGRRANWCLTLASSRPVTTFRESPIQDLIPSIPCRCGFARRAAWLSWWPTRRYRRSRGGLSRLPWSPRPSTPWTASPGPGCWLTATGWPSMAVRTAARGSGFSLTAA